MPAAFARIFPQPVVALLMSVFASVAAAAAWVTLGWGYGATKVEPVDLLVAALLVGWVAAGYRFHPPATLPRRLR